jgi:hypothetical protein
MPAYTVQYVDVIRAKIVSALSSKDVGRSEKDRQYWLVDSVMSEMKISGAVFEYSISITRGCSGDCVTIKWSRVSPTPCHTMDADLASLTRDYQHLRDVMES